MIIDCHTHVFPAAIRDERDRYCRQDSAFRLLYQSSKAKLHDMTELLYTMEKQQVDLSVIFGFPWKDRDTFERHNNYIIEAVQSHPHRFRGFGCFDLFHRGAVEETRRCLAAGLSGIGELAVYGKGLDECALQHLAPVMAICLEYRRPVMLHVNEPIGHAYAGKSPVTLKQIYRLVQRFPDNKIILAHWGGGILFYSLLKKEVRDTLKNVYVDTAASPFLYEPQMYAVMAAICGAERILFGSDYPLLQPRRYFEEMQDSSLSEEQIQLICGGNAMRLLGMDSLRKSG
jgi:hypothetical protein